MRRLLVLPLLLTVCLGLDLPDTGPLPAQKPRQPETTRKALPPKPPEQTQKAPLPGISAPEPSQAGLARCETELERLGAVFTRAEPVTGENGCGIKAPYALTGLAGGVTLQPATRLRCKTALALARWIDSVVVPASKALPGEARMQTINHGSTYVCRRRNNLPTGKMSEHSIGNAIDIVSFEFSGRNPIGISPRTGDGTIEEAFQRTVRAGACLHFTTVLGPGVDASHADHLHLDIASRSRNYRLCQ